MTCGNSGAKLVAARVSHRRLSGTRIQRRNTSKLASASAGPWLTPDGNPTNRYTAGVCRAPRWLFAIYAALSVYFTWPVLSTGRQLGIEDWDVLLFYHASAFKSVYEYAALPFWNPWYCGGSVLWQNPQVALISPVYPLSLVVSLPVAMKVTILLHYLLGFAGMHLLLTGALGVAWWPIVLLLASIFTLAGGPVFHLAVGHATFLPYFYLPWMLNLFVRAIQTGAARYAIGAAMVLALTVYAGGLHILVMAAVALTVFALAASIARRDPVPAIVLAATGLFALLLAAPKLLPTAVFLRDARLVDTRSFVPGGDMMTANVLEHSLLDAFQFRRMRVGGQSHGWAEYGNYIGQFGFVLIVASFVWAVVRWRSRREHWLAFSLACTAAVLLALAVGEVSPYAPFMLLRRLPFASQLRVPSRYLLLWLLFAVALVGAVVQQIRVPDRAELKSVVAVMCVVAVGLLVRTNRLQLESVFALPPLQATFRWHARSGITIDAATPGYGRDSPMTRAIFADRAIVQCYEPLQLAGHIDAAKPLVFAEGRADIFDISFSPNRVQFRTSTHERARIYLNERYIEGWHSDAGPLSVDPAPGLAYVTVPANTIGKFSFWFVPPGLIAGILMSASGLIGALFVWPRRLSLTSSQADPVTTMAYGSDGATEASR
jgi:hypothetical protein